MIPLGLLLTFWLPLQKTVIAADLIADRGTKKTLATQGLQLAEACIAQHPNEVACYYYRGHAKGILQGNSFLGYTTTVRAMLADWEKARQLDATFDHGGPYRVVAELYTQLPRYFGPKDLRQNLPRALENIQKAVAISDYPINLLDLAEIDQKMGKNEEAKMALKQAKQVLPQWRADPYYPTCLEMIRKLENQL